MRIAFYAPLKSPTHLTPSGDRRVARLLMGALERAGHRVDLASTFRSFDETGHPAHQATLRDQGALIARVLMDQWSARPDNERPEMWFTYHVYYKAPDWLGPAVSAALGIPYVIAEASYAPKRAGGRWALGHEAARQAIGQAALVLSPSRDDVACLESVVLAPARIVLLQPFLDPAPYAAASRARDVHRARLAVEHGLDAGVPWIVVAAMMRPGDKVASYRMLAAVLGCLSELSWELIVAGDGSARIEVESMFEAAAPGRARFVGERSTEELAEIFSACDLYVWPAVNEAYGMAMLEAQAAGIPVVSCDVRGVPDVVCDGFTGLLTPAGDEKGLSERTRTLLLDSARRSALGHAAAKFVADERSVEAMAFSLGRALDEMLDRLPVRRASAANA